MQGDLGQAIYAPLDLVLMVSKVTAGWHYEVTGIPLIGVVTEYSS